MRISDWSSDVCSSDLRIEADAVQDPLSSARAPQQEWLGPLRSRRAAESHPGGRCSARTDGQPASGTRQPFPEIAQRYAPAEAKDRKSVVSGKSVSVRVDLGGRRIIKKKTQKANEITIEIAK